MRREINQLISRLTEQRISIKLDPGLVNKILKSDQSPVAEGARSLKRLIQKHITSPLTTAVLSSGGKDFDIKWHKNKVVIK